RAAARREEPRHPRRGRGVARARREDRDGGVRRMSRQWRIVVGADDAGVDYKEIIKADLEASDLVASVQDVGVDRDGHTAYPHIAVAAAQLVAEGKADRAILICGTGLGVAI